MNPGAKTTHVGTAEFVPDSHDLDDLASAARACRGCDLCRDADQAVFGAGDPGSTIMFVREQPGDQEGRAGEPFVGPAGCSTAHSRPPGSTARSPMSRRGETLHVHPGSGSEATNSREAERPDHSESVVATVPPWSILRGPAEQRDQAFDAFVADFRVVRDLASTS